jgi:transposase
MKVVYNSKTKNIVSDMTTVEFPQLIERGCGLDVHQETVVATIRGIDIEIETRTYGTFTPDLECMIGWLQNHGVTHIAMESTGVYWKPVYYVLEPFFEILLVNARHIKNVPGHKTDKKDSEWIAKLLLSGLLKGSFVPEAIIRELRDLQRHRKKLINQRTAQKNRLQNILEDANIKLSSVVSDVFGKTGQAILEQLAGGQVDPVVLANLAKGSLINKKDQLQLALQGRFSSHHQFMVKLMLDILAQINAMIVRIEDRVERYLAQMQPQATLLQTIPGVSTQVAAGILSEIGTDMSKFTSHKHLASWAGACPGNNQSAGKSKSSRATQGNKYLKTMLVEAGWSAAHTKNTYLANRYSVLASRRGSKKATLAIGHKILSAAYYILRDNTPYIEPRLKPQIAQKRKEMQIERLQRTLDRLKK